MIDKAIYEQLAEQYQFDVTAITQLAELLERTGGLSARFDIPALGGKGIWQQGVGGSIGNGFDDAANAKITALCKDISDVIRTEREQSLNTMDSEESGLDETIGLMPISLLPNAWWPDELGLAPDILSNAGTLRYAYFAAKNRLIIRQNLRNQIYDTTGHKVLKLIPGEKPGLAALDIRTESGSMPLADLPVIGQDASEDS